MDCQTLRHAIIGLVALSLIDGLVQAYALELDYDKADVHRELEEDQTDALRHKLVGALSNVESYGPEDCEACEYKSQLG